MGTIFLVSLLLLLFLVGIYARKQSVEIKCGIYIYTLGSKKVKCLTKSYTSIGFQDFDMAPK